MVIQSLCKEDAFADEVLISALECFDANVDQFKRYQQALTTNPDCYQTRQLVIREVHRHQTAQVSLEDFATQHGTLQLSVAVEGLVDRWLETRKKVMHRLTKGLVGDVKIASRKGAVATMRAKAKAFKEMPGVTESKKIPIGGDAQYVMVGGRLPTRMSQALTNDIRGLNEITQKYVPNTIMFAKQAQDAFTGVLSSSKDDVLRKLEEVAKQNHPMTQLSRPLLEGGQLSGEVYVTTNLKPQEDTVGKLKAMARAKPPRLKRKKSKGIEGSGEITMSQSEVQVLIKCLEQYADLMEKTNDALPRQLSALDYSKGFLQRGDKTNKRVSHPGIQPLRKLANTSTMQAAQIVPDVFNHIRQRAKVIISLLNKTLKTEEL